MCCASVRVPHQRPQLHHAGHQPKNLSTIELPATSDESTTATFTVDSSSTPPVPKRAWGDEDDDVGEHLESLTINLEPMDSDISVTTGDTPYTSASSFEDLNLSQELLKGLHVEMRFHKPSKIFTLDLDSSLQGFNCSSS
ncbi:unnamed protein product [Citrullus colocynthis]|uniref:Uncharacterized protein n=1 Tax=Citrullus colocynthis TaxID=252529 RepID=A0ABP0XXU9_9ROSI